MKNGVTLSPKKAEGLQAGEGLDAGLVVHAGLPRNFPTSEAVGRVETHPEDGNLSSCRQNVIKGTMNDHPMCSPYSLSKSPDICPEFQTKLPCLNGGWQRLDRRFMRAWGFYAGFESWRCTRHSLGSGTDPGS